jgi:hypothetical protein
MIAETPARLRGGRIAPALPMTTVPCISPVVFRRARFLPRSIDHNAMQFLNDRIRQRDRNSGFLGASSKAAALRRDLAADRRSLHAEMC